MLTAVVALTAPMCHVSGHSILSRALPSNAHRGCRFPGRAEFVKSEWIQPGATVIDVGINSKPCPEDKRGYKLVGDVDFEDVSQVNWTTASSKRAIAGWSWRDRPRLRIGPARWPRVLTPRVERSAMAPDLE